jgi:hypothetical protein
VPIFRRPPPGPAGGPEADEAARRVAALARRLADRRPEQARPLRGVQGLIDAGEPDTALDHLCHIVAAAGIPLTPGEYRDLRAAEQVLDGAGLVGHLGLARLATLPDPAAG